MIWYRARRSSLIRLDQFSNWNNFDLLNVNGLKSIQIYHLTFLITRFIILEPMSILINTFVYLENNVQNNLRLSR